MQPPAAGLISPSWSHPPFDTLAVVADLESAGMERRQAEAVAKAAVQAVTASRGEFATRADLAALEARIYLALVAFAIAIVGAVKLLP